MGKFRVALALSAAQDSLVSFHPKSWREITGLKGSKTEENLKAAFACESQANRRYLYFA